MTSPLFSGLDFSATAAWTPKAGDLVVFRPVYRTYDTGCRIVEIKSDGSLVLQVTGLDTKAPDWGMRFLANADQVRPAC